MAHIRITEKVAREVESLEKNIIRSSLTTRLDVIAGELEKVDPRMALALDMVSDRLEASSIDKPDAKKWMDEEKEELGAAKKLEDKVDDIHKMVKKLVDESEKDIEFSKKKIKELSK
jgi:hypothetical protein